METREKFDYYLIPEDQRANLQKDGVEHEDMNGYKVSLQELKEHLSKGGEALMGVIEEPALLAQCIVSSVATT